MLKVTSILQCPISGSDLSFIDIESLEEFRAQIQKGQLRHLAKVLTKWVRPVYAAKWLLKALPATFVNQLKKIFSASTPTSTADQPSTAPTMNKELELYFHPHDYAWFQREVASRPGWDLRVWRAASLPFVQQYVHAGLTGR